MIDKEANLFQAGLLTAMDIEDASDHELLAAGLNRDQIRQLRYVFVCMLRDAFGLPDRVKPERSRLNVPFESSPRPITPPPVALRTSPAAHSEARGLHEAESSRPLESSPGGNVASLAREAALATFLGRLGLAGSLEGLLQTGCLDPEDVVPLQMRNFRVLV